MVDSTVTLYQIANAEIVRCIEVYLQLAASSHGLTVLEASHLNDERSRSILLAGLGVSPRQVTPEEAVEEWRRRQALSFELETAICAGVYLNLRSVASSFYDRVEAETAGFTTFTAEYVFANPELLPLFQHLAGVFSKSKLKEMVGSVADTGMSKPAATRLAAMLQQRVDAPHIRKGEILQRLESTLEGIVRDLVGRVLLESIVEAALSRRNLAFLREEQYEALRGVVYDFRADFVLPDAENPLVFIEVRKSSSRHASLYAKDKMFSAINWKGHNPNLLAVLVVDGEWTKETLRVMANVFDYVVPVGRVDELAETIGAYVAGDHSKLRWLIEFRIHDAITRT